VFSEIEQDEARNQTSIFGKLKNFLPIPKILDSEWSFCQFRIPESKSICCFGADNTLIGKC
jgi:hypothetical protein